MFTAHFYHFITSTLIPLAGNCFNKWLEIFGFSFSRNFALNRNLNPNFGSYSNFGMDRNFGSIIHWNFGLVFCKKSQKNLRLTLKSVFNSFFTISTNNFEVLLSFNLIFNQLYCSTSEACISGLHCSLAEI